MTHNVKIEGFFADAEATMRQKFRGWENDIPHSGEKGGIRERRVKDFLTSILPKKYGVGTGHIIDTPNNRASVVSHQTDIVIYDAFNGVSIPVDDHYSIFPCECVYAAIEVKSQLNASDGDSGPSGTIYECLKNTTQLKLLNRARHGLPPIHSLVFAYATGWKELQADHIKFWFENLGHKHMKSLPEAVCVLDPGFILGTSGPSGYNDKSKFTNLYEKEPLVYLFADLLHRLQNTTVSTPNLWREYVNWQPGEAIGTIYRG